MTDVSLTDHLPPADGEERRGLFYPHGKWTPEPGSLFAVADGVFWLRMPLPFSLDHINLWVLDDGAGWAVVDTGLNAKPCKDLWRALMDGPLAGRPITRVIVTHYHPDHLGLAGWLCRKGGVPLEIARAEYLLARTLMLDVRDVPPEEAVNFYARAGWPADAVERLRASGWGRFNMVVADLPIGFQRLREGDVLRIGGRAWRVVGGSGHSPEHVCLVCDSDRLMISGDQVLPRITSNVSVYPTEPRANPLKDWLDSIDRLATLDPGLTVMPAHNEPFTRLHVRLDQLRGDHLKKLDALEEFCAEPRTAFDSFKTLFGRAIGEGEIQMATGEALAHLHWLEAHGRVERIAAPDADRFVRV
jgi:glyoxylase-like metal-dependent hydrolase (beta-lactamase superfamily II)